MSILEKEPVKRVEKYLKKYDSNLNITLLNSSARTALEAAASLNCEVGAIVKSLLLRTDDSFILCLVSGDKRCSLNKIKKILNKKDVSMANADQVKEITGYTIGGVSPIGHLTKVSILIDNNLARFEDIFAAAGHPNCIFKINFEQLLKLTNGKIEELAE